MDMWTPLTNLSSIHDITVYFKTLSACHIIIITMFLNPYRDFIQRTNHCHVATTVFETYIIFLKLWGECGINKTESAQICVGLDTNRTSGTL